MAERIGGGKFGMHTSVGVLQLNSFPHINMVKEIAFMFFVLGLSMAGQMHLNDDLFNELSGFFDKEW